MFETVLPVILVLYALHVFLTYPPDLDPFPYTELVIATAIPLLFLGSTTKKRWTSLSANKKRFYSKTLLYLSLVLGGGTLGMYTWAHSLVSDNHQVRQAIATSSNTLVSQTAKDATIAMEDFDFYNHHGFDWKAIHRALRTNLRAGRVKQVEAPLRNN
jgi:hypothetical protein